MESVADLLRGDLPPLPLGADEDGPGRGHARDTRQAEHLPQLHGEDLPVNETMLPLDEAVDLTRTGDLWLFRGRSAADHAIRAVTNAPGQPRRDGGRARRPAAADVARRARPAGCSTCGPGRHHRGVQLHDLRDAVDQWTGRYEQRAWLRQLDATVTAEMEDALLRTIARMDGTPFPATVALAGRWARGRVRRPAPAETTYCAEVVAATYQAMGLLGDDRARPTTTTPAASGPGTNSA